MVRQKHGINMDFEIVDIEDMTSEDVMAFIEKHGDDIETIFPHFDIDEVDLGSGYKLTSGGRIIGLFIYIPKGLEAHVELDYLIAEFQDQGIGKEFLQRKISEFRDEGYEEIISLTNFDRHKEYLKSLGFRQSNEHPDRFKLDL